MPQAKPVHKQMFSDVKTLLSINNDPRVREAVVLIKELEHKFDDMHAIGYHAGKLEVKAKEKDAQTKSKREAGRHDVRKGDVKKPARKKAT